MRTLFRTCRPQLLQCALLATTTLILPRLAMAQSVALPAADLSIPGMVANADWVVKGVMLGLVVASVLTWTVAVAKAVSLLIGARRIAAGFRQLLAAPTLEDAGARLPAGGGLCAELVALARTELVASAGTGGAGVQDRTGSAMERLVARNGRLALRGTGLLATIGATAPFVGLFGTVWGIMTSFVGIARTQTTNLAVIAPGIAEALLTTAAGLAAAIPAVVVYNLCIRAAGSQRAQLQDAAAHTLRLLSRDLDRAAGQAAPRRAAA